MGLIVKLGSGAGLNTLAASAALALLGAIVVGLV
jgi:hypothetical protein